MLLKFHSKPLKACVLCLPDGSHLVRLCEEQGKGFEGFQTTFIRPEIFAASEVMLEGDKYRAFFTETVYEMAKVDMNKGTPVSFSTHRLTWALLFQKLLDYTGVGGGKAASTLAKSDMEDVERAAATLRANDILRLKGLPPKAMEELRAQALKEPSALMPPKAKTDEDAVKALVAMGIDKKEARERIEHFQAANPKANTSELTTLALRNKR